MKNIKLLIGIALLIFIGFISFGLFTLPKVENVNSDRFSAERVAEDIKFISNAPHSVENPIERDSVRSYLYDRLSSLGGNPVIISYDSIKFRLGGYYDIGNVYCSFEPESGCASSYILLVAHLDSRFRQVVLKDTVYSYGAADDGYGLGIILESVSQALKYRNKWIQGVKVLFTDSEENELDGMKCAFDSNPEIFNNVGLLINIEARGVKGPALLFETSSNSDKLINLYKEAKYPCSYSLTSVVYDILPNFTDFSVVKDSISGYNFSVIDDLNYYHTDKDNYSNISLTSIQHYGAQLDSMIFKYLTDNIYSDSDYLNSAADDENVFFTAPGLGLFNFSKPQYFLFNAIIFALFCIAFAFNVLTGGVRVKHFFINSLVVFAVSVGVLLAGEGIAYIAALISGTPFDITSTKYVGGEKIINISSFVVMTAAFILFFIKKKRASHFFTKEIIFGTMFVMIILSGILLFTVGENFFFIIPVALCSLSMICYSLVFLNIIALPSLLAIVLLVFPFLYNLIIALTIGSLGIVLFVAFFTIILIVGLFDCYMYQKR